MPVSLARCLALAPHAAGHKDCSEFTAGLAMLGLGHPTGCALQNLAGHFSVRLLHASGTGRAWATHAGSAHGATAR